mmetsp:Transcript_126593/g.405257  ORF Transcript_126593/g.405257 Transcript_126593/m.405257 type:complete len:400 (+) Transcript_126593:104-1303(+)
MDLACGILRRTVCLAVVLTACSMRVATGQADCGAHAARSCDYCPNGNGRTWCNGQCEWVIGPLGNGQCVDQELAATATWRLPIYSSSMVFSGCIMLAFACYYKARVVDQLSVVKGGNHWKDAHSELGPFACLSDRDTCLTTTFCLPVVAAKNYHITEVCSFWPACVLIFLGTYSPFVCVTAIIRGVLTGRVRERLGYSSSCLQDIVLGLFCFPCEVGRESLEIDHELAVKISCGLDSANISSGFEGFEGFNVKHASGGGASGSFHQVPYVAPSSLGPLLGKAPFAAPANGGVAPLPHAARSNGRVAQLPHDAAAANRGIAQIPHAAPTNGGVAQVPHAALANGGVAPLPHAAPANGRIAQLLHAAPTNGGVAQLANERLQHLHAGVAKKELSIEERHGF